MLHEMSKNSKKAFTLISNFDTRRHPRYTVDFDIMVIMGDDLISGTVRDISKGGMFIQPNAAQINKKVLLCEDVLKDLYAGKRLQVRIGENVKSVLIDADIRWVGKSQTHNCLGFGLAFKKEMDKII